MTAPAPARSPFNVMLAPLDESPTAIQVFETAVVLARLVGAQVHLLRVVAMDPAFPPAAHVVPDGLEKKLLADGLAALQGFMAGAAGVDFAPARVVIGDPWRCILEAATQIGADVIVMGSHRYHGMDRVLGTVAAKVVNHATRNVLVVHPRPVGDSA